MLPSSIAPLAAADRSGSSGRDGGRALRKRYKSAMADPALI